MCAGEEWGDPRTWAREQGELPQEHWSVGWGTPQRGPAWSPDSVTRCPGLTWVVRAGHRPGGQEADVAPFAGAAGEQGLARHPELCFLLTRRQHPERPDAGGFQQPGEARVLLPTQRRGFCCLGLPPSPAPRAWLASAPPLQAPGTPGGMCPRLAEAGRPTAAIPWCPRPGAGNEGLWCVLGNLSTPSRHSC